MSAEAETSPSCDLLPMPDSEDSDEEFGQEEHPGISWSELSIIERVGLNSVEMSEKDLESAFTQIALAFRCDQYTLKQRLQAEEHARNLAEENVQLELSRGRETLETLKGLCLDSTRSTILQKLELSLDILGGTVERISNTAEVLGAVHQEARVSRAVELMVAHVESLRRSYDRNAAELEEARKALLHQQNSFRSIAELKAGSAADPEDGENRMKCPQSSLRRRVSISLITNQTQDKKKQESKKQTPCNKSSPTHSSESSCSAVNKEDTPPVDDRPVTPEEAASEPPAEHLPQAPPPAADPTGLPLKPVAVKKTQNKSLPLDSLRHRQRGKAALSKKKDKRSPNIHRQLSTGCLKSRPPPPAHWLQRCRWTLLCSNLLVLFCVLSLSYFLWKLQDGAFGL